MPSHIEVAAGRPAVSGWYAWGETALLAATGPLVGLWIRPEDPVFLRAAFCWPVIAPVLVALRYGAAYGLVATAAIFGAALWIHPSELPSGQLVAGALVLVLLAAQMMERVSRRLERAEKTERLAVERTNRFVVHYHALVASHALLESSARAAGGSLREALSGLRRRAASFHRGYDGEREIQQAILELFAEHGGAHVAAFHAVDAAGELAPAEVMLGKAPASPDASPILVEALQRREVVSEAAERCDGPGALAGIPLVDVGGRVAGVIAVYEMPSVALTADTLQLLAVLAGACADIVASFGQGEPETAQRSFVAHLRRAMKDRRRHGLVASLVCATMDDAQGGERLSKLIVERRASDHAWMTQDAAGEPVLAFILELSDESGAAAFARRLAEATRLSLATRVHAIESSDSIESLVSFIREPRHAHEARHLRAASL